MPGQPRTGEKNHPMTYAMGWFGVNSRCFALALWRGPQPGIARDRQAEFDFPMFPF
jgi:hypothetical protein